VSPERWHLVGELFEKAVSMPPAERAEWLNGACDADAELRLEVANLLAHDARAEQSAFLSGADTPEHRLEQTPDWPSYNGRTVMDRNHESDGTLDREDSTGFRPKAAIVAADGDWMADETRVVVRSRLREMAVIYGLIFGMFLILRPFLLGLQTASIFTPFWWAVAILAGLAFYLSRPSPLTLRRLRFLELVMVISLASFLAFYQARALIEFSLENDLTRAQSVMKNFVLLTSILILTYGIYVPKSWQRAAIVSGILAIVPLTTILTVCLLYPDDLQWAFERRDLRVIPLRSWGVDAVFLLFLAAISAFGARTISRLREQVVEARQLGQYRLGRRIGSGGMGDVYLAEHQLLKRPCAVKLIRRSEMLRSETVRRFEREVRLNATLSHPNIVEIFDYGRTEQGLYYYVMEYLPGLSLAELVKLHGPVPPERAVYLLRQVCLALHEAHEAGLIHRDIKPSNIFAARRGGRYDVAKLLDFGLVRPASTALAPEPSAEGRILGTPLYMSPEQAMGERALDARSDIYSLGAVAYFLLTGRPPFDEGTAIAALIAHARDQAPPPSRLSNNVPEDLDHIVMRCLAKTPSDRFTDAESLELALAECSCAGKWDKEQANRWWQERGRVAAQEHASALVNSGVSGGASQKHAGHAHAQVGVDQDQFSAGDKSSV
jgi:eukaryotic-like serine/threonine-protein kinase